MTGVRTTAAAPRTAHVLLVEDSAADAALFEAMLEERGASIAIVEHARLLVDALDAVKRRDDLDCIVLDLSLPDAEGLEALTRLQGAARWQPIVVLTGRNDHATSLAALRHGAEDYLVKSSIDGERLDRAISYAVERRAAKRELADREVFVRAVMDAFGAHTAVLDRAGRIIDVNASWREFALANGGYPQSTGPGTDYLGVCEKAAGDGSAEAYRAADGIRDVLHGRRRLFELDYECSSPDEERWFSLRATAIPEPHAGAVVFHVPITELKRTEAQLNHLAMHDPLTGLPNRQLVLDRLARAARSRARRGSFAVMFLDVDQFKLINDRYGHVTGDEVLVELGRRLRAAVRPRDTVGRLGGDEFVVLCEDLAGEVDAVGLSERLFRAVTDTPVCAGHERVRLSVSIGIALGTDPSLDIERLLEDADIAMYEAKARGRARHAMFDETLRRRSHERLDVAQALADALDTGGVQVHYQPQVALDTGRCYGVEALIRWNRPGAGWVPTPTIVDVAESTGLIIPLGAYVLERACSTVARAGGGLQVAVNVSAREIADGHVPETVANTLQRTGLAGERLCLELTETAMMGDVGHVSETLRQLRRLGVGVSLDDFGTGHAMLGHLKRLPVDELKIDRTFVAGLGSDRGDTQIVTAVTRLAEAFGLRVVAEGIERPQQARALLDIGCMLGQGYHYGRPSPDLPG